MTNIEYLLEKYEKPTSSERHTREYRKKLKQERAVKHRHLVVGELIRECPFNVSKTQIKIIRYYINTVKNFKKLHKQASNETIILAFIFLHKTLDNPRIDVEKFSISKKYGLNNSNFKLIICRLHKEIMESLPVTIHETSKDNYEYLEKSEY